MGAFPLHLLLPNPFVEAKTGRYRFNWSPYLEVKEVVMSPLHRRWGLFAAEELPTLTHIPLWGQRICDPMEGLEGGAHVYLMQDKTNKAITKFLDVHPKRDHHDAFILAHMNEAANPIHANVCLTQMSSEEAYPAGLGAVRFIRNSLRRWEQTQWLFSSEENVAVTTKIIQKGEELLTLPQSSFPKKYVREHDQNEETYQQKRGKKRQDPEESYSIQWDRNQWRDKKRPVMDV